MSYTPRNPPADVSQLSDFLAIELQKIAQEWTQTQPFLMLDTLYVEPRKPREGMVIKADGSTWNPGSGAGVYLYRASAWRFLG